VTNRRIIDLTLCDVLHIPDLHSNLISIPKICGLDLVITFSKNNVIASFSDRRMVIYRVQYEELYHVKTVGEPKVFIASSVQRLCSIDRWYYRLYYTGMNAIWNLYKKELVVGLDITRQLQMIGVKIVDSGLILFSLFIFILLFFSFSFSFFYF